MAAYRTGSDPIEIGDLSSKVKVTVTWNMSKFVKKCWSNRSVEFDAVFFKWLLLALVQTQMKFVTLGLRSRIEFEKWNFKLQKICPFKMKKKCVVDIWTLAARQEGNHANHYTTVLI